MSSTASSSGIESDTDSSPSRSDSDKDRPSISDTNPTPDNDDEGFSSIDVPTPSAKNASDQTKPSIQSRPTSSKSIPKKPTHYPYSMQNPYDDDPASISVIEDWDEECQMVEPYYYPGYIRRAQWPNHWRWTPPLGIRRTCTQQLHRNLGFERSGLYDDLDCSPVTLGLHHLTWNLR